MCPVWGYLWRLKITSSYQYLNMEARLNWNVVQFSRISLSYFGINEKLFCIWRMNSNFAVFELMLTYQSIYVTLLKHHSGILRIFSVASHYERENISLRVTVGRFKSVFKYWEECAFIELFHYWFWYFSEEMFYVKMYVKKYY